MKEVELGLAAHDQDKKGYVPANEVKAILMNLGEKLSRREGSNTLHTYKMSISIGFQRNHINTRKCFTYVHISGPWQGFT